MTSHGLTLPSAVVDEHYPVEWESDVVLTDGGTVHLRPIRADDDAGLLGLFARLSQRVDLHALLLAGPGADRPAARSTSRTSTTTTAWRSSPSSATTIVAVARYDRTPGADEAEVAFTVQDDQQGRGLATIMLEHLAAVGAHARHPRVHGGDAARQPAHARRVPRRGLPGRARVRRRRRARHVPDRARPSASQAMQDEREQISEARSVRRLLAPRSIAVIGAGRRAGHDRPRGVPQPARRRLHRARVPGQPARGRRRERARVPDRARRPRPGRPRGRHRARRVGRRRRARVRGEGRPRARRDQRRVRRAGQRRRRAGARRARPPARDAARRPERHGRRQHRTRTSR